MTLAAIVAILCLSALAGWVVAYQLLLQNGRMLTRIKRLERRLDIPEAESEDPFVTGLPPGSLLNDFELPALSGGTRTLSSWRGRKLLLIFFSPQCSFCQQMLPHLAALDPSDDFHRPLPVVISTGGIDQNRRLFEEHRVRIPVLLQEEAELASLYRVNGTPMGYLVDEHGATATALVTGAKGVLDLIRTSPAAASTGTSKSLSRSRLESHAHRQVHSRVLPSNARSARNLTGSPGNGLQISERHEWVDAHCTPGRHPTGR